jgi:hypothetical protein
LAEVAAFSGGRGWEGEIDGVGAGYTPCDGPPMESQLGSEPYRSKIRFEQISLEKKGDIGELHHQRIK